MKKILMILIKKILMNKTGMKETLMKKTKYITFLGKYKHFFRFGAKKLHSLKYKNKTRNFFSQDWESFSWYMRNFKFFKLRDRKFHSLKYKKNFFLKSVFLEKYEKSFNLRSTKFHFPNYKKLFIFLKKMSGIFDSWG